MIIMPVPRDVREFKPKFIGPFSKREFIGVAVAAGLAVLTFAVTYPLQEGMTLNQRAVIVLVPAVVPLVCGFIDIQGMPIWVYVWNLIIQNFLAPRHRVYRTSNNFAEYAKRNRITMEYLDGDGPATAARKRRKQKEYDRALAAFVAGHPEFESVK
ncbi:MAG: PrgI family protein [Ruminococcus flavefaciens]|nr:PrgI family protein [Ruminococcus flavefaciens]